MIFSALVLAAATVVNFSAPSGTKIFNIKAPMEQGWEVNKDAPWSLQVKDAQGVTIDTQVFKADLPGYVLETKEKAAKGSFAYKMSSYFCRHDKSECRRVVYEGTVKIP